MKDSKEENLMKAEFEGLWNQAVLKYSADDFYTTQEKYPSYFKTKAEKVHRKELF
jgi:hypothetical protein